MPLSTKMLSLALSAAALYVGSASAHAAVWTTAMWGFDVRVEDFPYDNRPQSPLRNQPFSNWWFHGHLAYPPAQGQFVDLPAGGTSTLEISCNRGATSYFNALTGGDQRQGDNPCPGEPTTRFHANNEADAAGCGLAISYKSDVNQVQPEDFTIFSVNHKCVWNRFTGFDVPAAMPACPEGGCICAFFWIHNADSGGEENYMNGFRCKVSGASGTQPVGKGVVPVQCDGDMSKCTSGPKVPFYWYQAERNNVFNDQYNPPVYNMKYGYRNGAQNDIFTGSGAISPPSGSKTTAPAEQPATTSTPAEQPATTPVEQPATTPVQQPATTPVEQPATTPVQQPATTQAPATTQQQEQGQGQPATTSHAAAATTPAQEHAAATTTSVAQAQPATTLGFAGDDNTAAVTSSSLTPATTLGFAGDNHTAAVTSSSLAPTNTRKCKPRHARRENDAQTAAKRFAAAKEHAVHARAHKRAVKGVSHEGF